MTSDEVVVSSAPKVQSQTEAWSVLLSDGDSEVPGMFNPLLAYPRDVLDPGTDDSRDEGEERLQLLRAVLHMATNATPGLTDASGASSFTSKLVDKPAQEVGVHESVFKYKADWKPFVRLASLSTMIFSPEVVDTAINERRRVKLVPVRGSNYVAKINYPPERLPAAKLIMRFPRRHVGSVDAQVEIKRTGNDGFKAVVYSGTGKRNEVSARGVTPLLLDRLFARSLPCPDKAKMVPALPDELPLEISSAIADFWQRQKRCHCLAAALAPEGSRLSQSPSPACRYTGPSASPTSRASCTLHR